MIIVAQTSNSQPRHQKKKASLAQWEQIPSGILNKFAQESQPDQETFPSYYDLPRRPSRRFPPEQIPSLATPRAQTCVTFPVRRRD